MSIEGLTEQELNDRSKRLLDAVEAAGGKVCDERHQEVVARLLAVGADHSHVDARGRSIYRWAVERGNQAIVSLLEEAGAARDFQAGCRDDGANDDEA